MFLFFRQTLATQQGVIIGSALVLVAVAYLYTSVEGSNITFAQRGPGYQPYVDAASQRFHLTPVRETSLKFFALYKVEGTR